MVLYTIDGAARWSSLPKSIVCAGSQDGFKGTLDNVWKPHPAQKILELKMAGSWEVWGDLFLRVFQCFFISMVLHLPFHSELQNQGIISGERDLQDHRVQP